MRTLLPRVLALTALFASLSAVATIAWASGAASCSTATALPASAIELLAADFDEDTQADLVASIPTTGSAWLLRGDGAGGFGAPSPVGGGGDPEGLAAGDFDEDGRLDLAVAHPSRDELTIHRGNGDGTFDATIAYYAPGRPRAVGVGDFDSDGILDLAVVCQNPSRVALFFGRGTAGAGDGTFDTATLFPIGLVSYRPTRLRVADLDGDGALDLAVVIPNAAVTGILYGRKTAGIPDGTFNAVVGLSLGSATDLAVSDLDGDGLPDLNTTDASVSTIRTLNVSPARTYAAAAPTSLPHAVLRLGLGDFDGTNELDVAGAGAGAVAVALDGVDPWSIPLGDSVLALLAHDLDGDGRAEIVAARTTPPSLVTLWPASCPPIPPPPPPPPPGPRFSELSPQGLWGENGRLLVSEVDSIDGLNAVPDGAGGAYLTWRDRRAASAGEMFVLRVGPEGAPVAPWPPQGVRVRDAAGFAPTGGPVSGGPDGVYVLTCQGGDCFAHHFAADGSSSGPWPDAGLQLDTFGEIQQVSAREDGAGGLLVAQRHVPPGGNPEIRVHRLAPDGTPAPGWSVQGVLVAGGSSVTLTSTAADGDGGLYLAYDSYVPADPGHGGGFPHHGDTFVHVRGAAVHWQLGFADAVGTPSVASDGHGGAFGFYTSGGASGHASGWSAEGGLEWAVAVPFDLFSFVAADGDGHGGALFVGRFPNPETRRLYRADATGALGANGWPAAGLDLGGDPFALLLGNLDGGALVGTVRDEGDATRSLRLRYVSGTATTAPGWPVEGMTLRRLDGSAIEQSVRGITDGADGVFVYWVDTRGGDVAIYGQHLGPDPPVAARPTVIDHAVEDGLVRLRWFVDRGMGVAAAVERRDASTDTWETRGTPEIETPDRLSFEDRVGPAGGVFDYRLVVQGEEGPLVSDVVQVVVPGTTARLHLALPRNPLRGTDRIRIVPASAEPISIALHDATGRRIGAVRVTPTAGRDVELDLARFGSFRPGVAFLRIRQGTATVTRKVVLVD